MLCVKPGGVVLGQTTREVRRGEVCTLCRGAFSSVVSRWEAMQSDTLVLQTVQCAIAAVGLDAIIIGNVAAALHGAPVTTLDIDYFIRDTRLNDEKLKRLAERLGVHISRPFEAASMVRRAIGLEVELDFVVSLSAGMKFESVKSRASAIDVGGVVVIAASLEDVIASKRAAGRPKDLAVLPILEATLEVRNKMFR